MESGVRPLRERTGVWRASTTRSFSRQRQRHRTEVPSATSTTGVLSQRDPKRSFRWGSSKKGWGLDGCATRPITSTNDEYAYDAGQPANRSRPAVSAPIEGICARPSAVIRPTARSSATPHCQGPLLPRWLKQSRLRGDAFSTSRLESGVHVCCYASGVRRRNSVRESESPSVWVRTAIVPFLLIGVPQ